MSVSFYVGGVLFQNGDILTPADLPAASTTEAGISQLNDTTSSTSTAQAATANAVKVVYDAVVAAQSTATAALPLTGGTMIGDISFYAGQTIPVSSIADATTSTKGLVQAGTNINATDGVISVASASTLTPGVVELNDSTTSTSITQALTANQGKNLQDQITALSVTSNITLGGTFNANTGLVASVTTQGTAAGLVVGNALPAPSSTNNEIFVIVDVQGTNGPNSPVVCHVGDWFLSDGTTWNFLNVGFAPGQATTTSQGVVQLATDAQVQAGLDSSNVVVSSALQSKMSDSTSTTSSSTIASSAAVKSAYDAGIQGQTDAAAALTAANTAGTDVGTLASLTTTDKTSAVAAINEVNAAASAAQGDATQALSDASAAQATADAAVPDASYTALGAILTGTGAGTYAALTLGTNTNVLTVDTTCPGGLKWAAGGGGGGSGTVTSITAGAGLTGGTITTSGTIAINSTCVLEPADFTASGQLLAGTGTGTYTALAVGSNAQVLTADSACTGGVKWAAAAGGGTLATPIACGVVYGCSSGADNVSLGFGAIRCMSGASIRNVAMGNNAMVCLTTSHCCNIAIGVFAMAGSAGSTGFLCNVAIGNASMGSVTGSNIGCNVYVGADTAAFGTGSNNVAVGFCSQRSNCGSGNTSVGTASLAINTGINNVAVGLNAGCALSSTAACNILIGAGAGCLPSVGALTGCNNVIIGINKGLPAPTGNNQLVLGGWLTGCSTLAIQPAAGIIDCGGSCGTLGQYMWTTGSNAIIWASSSPSDVRDKEVIGPVPTALPVVQQIEPITYRWKERDSGVAQEEVIYGFSAQQLQEVDAVLVDSSDPDHLRIHDRKIVPLLVNAIKELSERNDLLEARIAALEGN